MDNQSTASEPVGETWKYNSDFHRMADFMGVDKYDRNDFELAKKMSALQDWGGNDAETAMGKINDLRKSLGYNTQGKTLVNQLFQQIRLESHKKEQMPKSKVSRTSDIKPSNNLEKTVTTAVQQRVQQTIGTMVQKALSDKKLIEKAVQEALKGAIK